MARELKEEGRGVLEEARDRFEVAWQYDEKNREDAREDLHFRAGEQWPEKVRTEREESSRPTLTINRMPQFVKQVTGDIRQNRPSIKVRPVDSGSDPDVADIFSGIIRHIEQRSDAQSAYITAADSSVTCGIGHFRVLTEFSSDDSFEQDIRIARIRNPFAVYWDPDAEELDKSDARWCFVSERISMEAFRSRYPDASTADFEANATRDWLENWWDGESVRIAEYWTFATKTETLVEFEDGTTGRPRDGVDVVRSRTISKPSIVRYVLNGVEILEGPDEWAGRHLPIVPVIGEEVHIGDRIVRHGIVRFAKDPQRLYNYWRTTAAESIALAPKAPWLLTPTMIEGQKAAWEAANRGNPPYLLYTPDSSAPGGPSRQQPPLPPTAMWSEATIAAEDMKATTGIYDASLGARGNETSGRAILARQQEGDTSTFVYIDNLSRAIRRAGEILIDLIPKIYDTDRVVRILGEDETEDFVRLNAPVPQDDGTVIEMTVLTDSKGNPVYKPPLDFGKYDVAIVTGPSYSTKRMEASDSLMAFAQAVPAAGAVIADLIAKNMDWPGAEQIAERLRKTLPPGLADDEEELTPEQMAMRQQAAQQQQMAMQVQLANAQAEIAKAQASAAKDAASVGKTQAETEGQRIENAQQALQLAMQNGQMQAAIEQIVQQQVMQILGQMTNMQQ